MTRPGEPSAGGSRDNVNNTNNVVVLNYDAENGVDPPEIHSRTGGIRVDFNRANVRFFFSQLEMHMEASGVLSQWLKRLLLQRSLPSDIVADMEDLLTRGKAEAGATAYKDVKDRIMELYGPRPEDVYRKAKDMVLLPGMKPSQLAKQMIGVLCPKHPTLQDCCAEPIISGMWRDQLPKLVRAAVANLSLGGGNLTDTLRTADNVFVSTTGGGAASNNRQVAAMAAAEAKDLPSSAETEEVAALRRNQQRQQSGKRQRQQQRGQGQSGARPSASQNDGGRQNQNKGDPHPDGPPQNSCWVHWNFGKSALYCKQPHSCPWVNFTVPRSNSR